MTTKLLKTIKLALALLVFNKPAHDSSGIKKLISKFR